MVKRVLRWLEGPCRWINEIADKWGAEVLWFTASVLISAATASFLITGLSLGAKWWDVMVAFGTVGAVSTSLWLAAVQRKRDVESLKVSPSISMTVGGVMLSLTVVSNGIRPVTVKGVAFVSKHAKSKLHVVNFFHASALFPVTLQYGEDLSLIFKRGFESEITRYVESSCSSNTDGLGIEVFSTLGGYSAPLSQNIIDFIKNPF